MRMPLRDRSKDVALCGMLLSLALLLSYIEGVLGLRIPFVPFAKLGLANIIVTFAFFYISPISALAVSVSRVIIMGLLFGGPISFCYSLFGAILAFGGLFISKMLGKRISYIGASVLCACFHNIGQISVCAFFFGTHAALFYLPYLLLCGAVFGTVTGILLNFISKKYEGTKIK